MPELNLVSLCTITDIKLYFVFDLHLLIEYFRISKSPISRLLFEYCDNKYLMD